MLTIFRRVFRLIFSGPLRLRNLKDISVLHTPLLAQFKLDLQRIRHALRRRALRKIELAQAIETRAILRKSGANQPKQTSQEFVLPHSVPYVVHTTEERAAKAKCNRAAIKIQKVARGWLARQAFRREYRKVSRAVQTIESFWASVLLRKQQIALHKKFLLAYSEGLIALAELEEASQRWDIEQEERERRRRNLKPVIATPLARHFAAPVRGSEHPLACLFAGLAIVDKKEKSNNEWFFFSKGMWHLTFGVVSDFATRQPKSKGSQWAQAPVLYTCEGVKDGDQIDPTGTPVSMRIKTPLRPDLYEVREHKDGFFYLQAFQGVWHGGLIVSTKKIGVEPKRFNAVRIPIQSKVPTPFNPSPTVCEGCGDLICFCSVLASSLHQDADQPQSTVESDVENGRTHTCTGCDRFWFLCDCLPPLDDLKSQFGFTDL